jgi:hypothetical protein
MISKSKVLKRTLGVLLLLALSLIVWLSLKSPQTIGGYRGGAIAQLPEVLPENLSDLGKLVATNFSEYRANAVRWSTAYFGCLFGAAFLSACAGVLLKLESLKERLGLRNDLAAIMAALASLLITLLTLGSFEEKWRSNRIAAGDMENLAYDLLKSEAAGKTDAILTRIQKINEARNYGIAGTASLAEIEPIGDKTNTMETAGTIVEP